MLAGQILFDFPIRGYIWGLGFLWFIFITLISEMGIIVFHEAEIWEVPIFRHACKF